ncbi:alpha/beta hydrolase [Polycyclovorans algicola]|uniref:alpha/beta hydrolase n=1 Tax=Polycyclovorans algicola TaxID=616992 RepID=UPI0004A6C0DD|nr:alpha/beta hydrolase [Polycyclovorans algicola]
MNINPELLRLPTTLALPGEGVLHVAASLWCPATTPRAVWVCQPGGNMNRHYFDLQPPDSDTPSYSFAAQMVARGDAVLALDHLGIGDSDRPADGWLLTPERLAEAMASAIAEATALLPNVPLLGLGHSMGALMTVLTQDRSQAFVGVAVLGFATRGLPAFLPPTLKDLDGVIPDGDALRVHAERMFGEPFPTIHRRSKGNKAFYGSAEAETDGIRALKRATDCLLPIPALRSMMPGNVAAEAQRLTVPVFIGVGDRDLVGPANDLPAAFAAAPSVHLEVLADTGHSHFLFPSRVRLFDALADWAAGVV